MIIIYTGLLVQQVLSVSLRERERGEVCLRGLLVLGGRCIL